MRKNRMMRLASVLLVCVLLTTSVISGTFAKYTSEAKVDDKARVAYWGFGRAATIALDLFDDVYGQTVDSADGANVIAPGTEKEATFGFAYTKSEEGPEAPEVAYTFVVDAEITGNYTALDNNDNFVWTLNGSNYATVEKLLEAIEKLDGDKTYEAGTLPTGFGIGNTHTIGWAWDYSKNDAGDITDTAMGNADSLDNISITITITATQVN